MISKKRHEKRIEFLFILIIASCYFIASVFLHTFFEENDGIAQVLDALYIEKGKGYSGWSSNYWGPLYPTLLFLLNIVINNYFITGKLISAVSVAFTGYFIFKLIPIVCEKSNLTITIITLVSYYTNSFIVIESMKVENEIFSSLLAFSSIYFFCAYIKFEKPKYIWICSVLVGLALITRYTNLFLLVLPFLTLFKKKKKSFITTLKLLLISSFPSLIYIVYSYLIKGEYINYSVLNLIALKSNGGLYWWAYQSKYYINSSIFEVLNIKFIFDIYYQNFVSFFITLTHNLSYTLIFIPILLGIFIRLNKINQLEFLLLSISIIYILFRSIGIILDDFFLIIIPFLGVFSYYFWDQILKFIIYLKINIFLLKNEKFLSIFSKLNRFFEVRIVGGIMILFILLINFSLSYSEVRSYCYQDPDILYTDYYDAGEYLKNYSDTQETIIAVHIGYSYFSDLNFVFLPYLNLSLNSSGWDIFRISDYPDYYRTVNPFYIFSEDDDDLVDYLIIDYSVINNGYNPFFSQYFDYNTFSYNNYSLHLIYQSSKCNVFEISPLF